MTIVFLIHLAATLCMTGLIWFVQIVHYPLFARVEAEHYSTYQARHMALTSWVVGPLMLAEGVTAGLLVWRRPPYLCEISAWTGLALVVVLALSTAFLQVPQHEKLKVRFEADAHGKLVRTNWVRTAAWTVRSGILLNALYAGLNG
jgi:uncharacterized membrane protein